MQVDAAVDLILSQETHSVTVSAKAWRFALPKRMKHSRSRFNRMLLHSELIPGRLGSGRIDAGAGIVHECADRELLQFIQVG